MLFLDAFLKGLKPQFDDDPIDRLNYYYTPLLLVIFALTLSAKQFICWTTNSVLDSGPIYRCLGTIQRKLLLRTKYLLLPLNHYIPRDLQEREEREIGYYQWVPFILGLQGILFYLPCLIWRLLNWQSGCKQYAIRKRKDSVAVVATHIYDSLKTQQNLIRHNPISVLLRKGTYLTLLYISVKFIYLLQAITQFVLLNSFLGTDYTFWGFEILRDLANGREWQESGHFPRVTMCDFDVRVLGNKHRHTVQCVLMINMFNEKVYLFLWWWILLVIVSTIGSLMYWYCMSFLETQQYSFIAQYLRVYGLLDGQAHNVLEHFVNRCLRKDGIFILRLIATNAGDLITTDIVAALWKNYLDDEKKRAMLSPSSPPPPPTLAHPVSPVITKLDDVDTGDNFHEQLYH
ncbi:Innexin [Dirofilaria immitis]|nr:Innexin [Dirofilaria immitis]